MYQNEELDNKITQLRKGIFELAILLALYRKTHYGYSLVRELAAAGALDLKEGTIYPILTRLAKESLVKSEWIESSQGPPRKYYTLTADGKRVCAALNHEFRRLVALVETAGTGSGSVSDVPSGKKIIIRNENDEQ